MSLLDIKDLSHSFGEKQLFNEAEFQLNKGEHNITISDFLKSAFQSLYIKEEQMNLLYSKAAAKEALKDALKKFTGTVLLVSHEENFYRGWVDRVVQI